MTSYEQIVRTDHAASPSEIGLDVGGMVRRSDIEIQDIQPSQKILDLCLLFDRLG